MNSVLIAGGSDLARALSSVMTSFGYSVVQVGVDSVSEDDFLVKVEKVTLIFSSALSGTLDNRSTR